MEEPVFLQKNNVTVTKTRFMVPGQTYAINGVTSVATLQENPKRWPAIVAMVIGGLVMLAGFSPLNLAAIFGGLVLGVAGYFWFMALKPTFHVVLRSSSGEARALSGKDGAFISGVVEAINKALVARG
ncbi:MAG: hypothetical protein QOG31_349 [Thermoplasmata archaeon]|jgi:hypothetical protein|nr:hypothetical protein [Thermoplasmata archaeon]